MRQGRKSTFVHLVNHHTSPAVQEERDAVNERGNSNGGRNELYNINTLILQSATHPNRRINLYQWSVGRPPCYCTPHECLGLKLAVLVRAWLLATGEHIHWGFYFCIAIARVRGNPLLLSVFYILVLASQT